MRSLLLILVLLWLSACASLPSVPELPDWAFEGKVSLRMDRQTEVANIRWTQRGEQSLIRLSGPIGLGAVDIEADSLSMTISTAEGTRVIPAGEPLDVDGKALVLPWRAMSSWVRGQTLDNLAIPDQGLDQDGWVVRILRRGATGPSLMTFEHQRVALRLSISQWRLQPAAVGSETI